MSKNNNSFIDWIKNKYIFSVRSEERFLESSKATLSIYEVLIIVFVLLLSALLGSFLLFKYTPLRHFMGVDSEQQQQEYYELHTYADSLENIVQMNQNYLQNIQNIINGNISEEMPNSLDSQQVKDVKISNPSDKELALRNQVQEREQFTLQNNTPSRKVNFVTPINGVLSNAFNEDEEHFGIDIVAPKGSPVLATANGIVIYTTWSEQDGSTIILSHENDFISIYKHNEKILREIGERVDTGDAIALLGNSGENTSGYHVHFELWQNGIPRDPKKFISLNE